MVVCALAACGDGGQGSPAAPTLSYNADGETRTLRRKRRPVERARVGSCWRVGAGVDVALPPTRRILAPLGRRCCTGTDPAGAEGDETRQSHRASARLHQATCASFSRRSVVGSIIVSTSNTRVAGKPLMRACSCTWLSSSAR